MKFAWAMLLGGLMAGMAWGATPTEEFTVDSRVKTAQFTIRAKRLNTPIWRFNLKEGTNDWNATGWETIFHYAPSVDSAGKISVTGTVSTATVDFTLPTNFLGRAMKDGYAAVTVGKDDEIVTYAWGRITIEPAPEISAEGALPMRRSVYGPDYGPFLGDFSHWPIQGPQGEPGPPGAGAVTNEHGGTITLALTNETAEATDTALPTWGMTRRYVEGLGYVDLDRIYILQAGSNTTVNVSTNTSVAGQETTTWIVHSTGGGGGLFEGNILRLHDTALASDVLFGEVGMYRTIRPGNLPSAVINVAGTEIAWFDLLGMTMRYGSIHLLSDELSVNVAAYDGSAAAPAYTWAGGKTLGKYRFSYNGDYAEGFSVGGQRVWYWGNDGIHLDDGMQIFGLESKYDTSNPSNFLNQAAADDLYLARSSTHEAWTDAGGTYTATGVVATSTLLTNGIAAWEWTVDGPMMPVAEMSADGNTWMEAAATNAAQYFRVRLTSPDGFQGDLDTTITNIAAMSWTRPDLVDNEHDTVGQVLLVDTPVVNRQAATKKYVDDTVGGVNPANWSEYPATSIVRTDGYPVFLGGGWQIYDTEAEGMSYISKMDAWVDDGDLVIAGNGTPAITVETGLRGLRIDYFSLINASNAVVHVSTNNVDAAPMIQHTHSLLQPDWQMVELTSTTYPTPSNDVYVLTFAVPNYTESTHFFRAVQLSGEGQVRVHTPIVAEGGLTMEGVHRATWPDTTMLASLPHNAGTNAPTLYTPAHVGHQLIRSGGSNEVWQAFGTTTNDWLRVFP